MKLKTPKNTKVDIVQQAFKASEWAEVDNGWWWTVPDCSHTRCAKKFLR